MSIETNIQRIESLADTYISTKNKLDFVQMHGKIALSIYNNIDSHLGGRYQSEANQCIEILTISDPVLITGDHIDMVSSFFSTMILIHTNMKKKSVQKSDSQPADPIMGLFIFAMASVLIWSFSFLMTFGIENSTSIIILITAIGFVLVLKGKSLFGLGGGA